jgi:hypothetical protein
VSLRKKLYDTPPSDQNFQHRGHRENKNAADGKATNNGIPSSENY